MKRAFFKTITPIVMMAMFNPSKAQTNTGPKCNGELYEEIMKMDSMLFNAFNNRDTSFFKEFFTKDLEFYHDKSGLTGFEQTINFMRSTTQANSDLRRNLIEGSSEVYPIPDYGAMQIGKHQFCHTENGKKDCGAFRFIHIWQYKDGKWKISRVVSYDH